MKSTKKAKKSHQSGGHSRAQLAHAVAAPRRERASSRRCARQGGRSHFDELAARIGGDGKAARRRLQSRARRVAARRRDHPQSPRRILPARAPAARRRHRERASRRPRLRAAGRSLRAGVPRAAPDARNRCTATASRCASAARTTAAGRKARSSKFSSATRARSSAACTTSPASASWCPTTRASAIACWCRAIISAARSAGQVVLVKLIEQPTRTAQALGHVTRVLGEHAAPGMETEIAIHSHGLPFEFPREAVAEAEAFGRSVSARGEARARRPARAAARDDRRRGRARLRRCGVLRGSARRLAAASSRSPTWRRYVEPGFGARQRSAASRHVGLLSESRPADAARGAVERAVLAESEGRSAVHGLRDARRRAQGKVTRARFFEGVMCSAARLTYTKVAAYLANPTAGHEPEVIAVGPQLDAAARRLQGAAARAHAARRARLRCAGAEGALRRRGQDRGARRVARATTRIG